jgi:hypothetical protein
MTIKHITASDCSGCPKPMTLSEKQDLAIRIKAASDLELSSEVWTRGAHNLLRIAGFAGFDVKEIMIRCFHRRAKSMGRINARTVGNVMGEMSAEYNETMESVKVTK